MATGRKRVRVRLSLGVDFDSVEAKAAFCGRLESLRKLFTAPGQKVLDNHGLLSSLFDCAERSAPPTFPGSSRASLPGSSTSSDRIGGIVQSFNSNAGMY